MVYVYVANITSLPDPKGYPELLEKLPALRQEKIHRLQTAKGRRQSLGAALLLMKILDNLGIDGNALSLGEHGKPILPGVEFNLSHSGDLVLCAVGDRPVGCDLQKMGHPLFDKEFLRKWTLTESYAKMTGEGMALLRGKTTICLQDSVEIFREGKQADCHFKEYEADGYLLAVCSQETEFSELIWETV